MNMSISIPLIPAVGFAALSLYFFYKANNAREESNLQLRKAEAMKEANKFEAERDKKELEKEKGKNINEIMVQKKLLADDKQLFDKIVAAKVSDFPIIGEILSEFYVAKDLQTARQLERKAHPAQKAADEVRAIAKEKRALISEVETYKFQSKYYECLFPWLEDFKEDPLVNITVQSGIENEYNTDDAVSHWLSKEEYHSLSVIERNQRALDRYCNRKKTHKEIGRDYERYIGYLYEKMDYAVEYHGIFDGFEDLGRDLICKKADQILIVQCKCWAAKKVIHEKHINQLFGTTVHYFLKMTDKSEQNISDFYNALKNERIKPVFVTSTELSDTALSFSEALDVKVIKNKKIERYPLIKCNVNQSTGEKIYHLPFDQQYDNTKIALKGEFFAETVAEAEMAGFRRAFKWHGNNA